MGLQCIEPPSIVSVKTHAHTLQQSFTPCLFAGRHNFCFCTPPPPLVLATSCSLYWNCCFSCIGVFCSLAFTGLRSLFSRMYLILYRLKIFHSRLNRLKAFALSHFYSNSLHQRSIQIIVIGLGTLSWSLLRHDVNDKGHAFFSAEMTILLPCWQGDNDYANSIIWL